MPATAEAIHFEIRGQCYVALVALERLLGKRHVLFSKTMGEEESWAIRDFINGQILRSGASNLTASQIEAEVTHSARQIPFRSVEAKERWAEDCKVASEGQYGANHVDLTTPPGCPNIGRWRRMTRTGR